MKQILILSGKGGTGKTTIAGALIKLSKARAYADCDVDAPNLHLIANQSQLPKKKDYYGLPKAEINQALCIQCDECYKHCRFDAIIKTDETYCVDYFACEGCSVCQYVCPADAITMNDAVIGQNILYKGEDVFSTALLKMGSGNSGKLVSEVKTILKDNTDAPFAIIDGSPGIGCPVIASLSGADIVLIVAEPSVSGISDMERIIATSKGFDPVIAVCINKYDTNVALTEKIESYCRDKGIILLGRIPFDAYAVKAVNEGITIVDMECPAGIATRKIFEKLWKLLKDNYNENKSFK